MTYDNTYKPARRICGTMALIILLTLAARTATAQTIFHVTPDGTQGSTAWTDAMTLTEALDAARAGDQIWVQGFETIDSADKLYTVPDDDEAFTVPSGVSLYGGFRGDETSIDERVTTGKLSEMRYRSVLSGDRSQNDAADESLLIFPGNATRDDNAAHVVVMNLTPTAASGNNNTLPTVIDGFSIAEGHADGNPADASGWGGGIFVTGDNSGGGAFSITRCFLVNNYARRGGAVYVDRTVVVRPTTSTISYNTVFNNAAGERSSANNSGGGLYVAGAANVVNCEVFNNENGGIAIAPAAAVINSTVARNTGSGIEKIDDGTGEAYVYNTVIWGNSYLYSTLSPRFIHSAYHEVQLSGDETVDADGNRYVSDRNRGNDVAVPMFESPSLRTSYDREFNWRTMSYPLWSWDIQEGSAFIDGGDGDMYDDRFGTTDMAGQGRLSNGMIDIGAYEYQAIPASRIRYVKPGGSDMNSGDSWDAAYRTIQHAIDALAATPGMPGEVWVAAGTYEPTTYLEDNPNYPASFRMSDGISVYGGFEGKETSKAARKIKAGGMPWDFANVTILQGQSYSGEINWNNTDNRWSLNSASTHVVWFAPLLNENKRGFDNVTILDGVTVRGGQATTSQADYYNGDRGAGIYMCVNAWLTNSVVTENVAQGDGSAVWLSGGRVMSSLLFNNSSDSRGGAIYMDRAGIVLRSMLANNSAYEGAGIYMDNNGPWTDGVSHPEYLILSTSIVSNNTSSANGAVYCNKGGVVLQSTITNNSTPRATDMTDENASQSGGLYIDTYTQTINTVLWNNRINGANIQVYVKNPSPANVRFLSTAVASMNNVVWNNTVTEGVLSLSDTNTATGGQLAPGFSTNGQLTESGIVNDYGVQGDWTTDWTSGSLAIENYWQPVSGSNLRAQGAVLGTMPDVVLIEPEQDLGGSLFAQKPSIGAWEIAQTALNPEEADGGSTLRLYVDVNSTDPDHDGSSWDNAYRSLNEAIAYFASLPESEVGDKQLEIYVKEGDLFPIYAFGNLDPKTATLDIKKTASRLPLRIIGGWSAADGTTRDPLNCRSILEGNQSGTTLADGLYHVVMVEPEANVVLDGFYVTRGYAAGTATITGGAGMLIYDNATVEVRNSVFENNTAVSCAAIDGRQQGVTLTLVNCVINNNTNTDTSAPVVGASTLHLNHVTMVNNEGAAYTATSTSNSFAAGNTSGDTMTFDTMGEAGAANFTNPSNVAGAVMGHDTYYGGYADWTPLTGSTVMASQIINRGAVTAGLDNDIAMHGRDLGGVPDIGAYEAALPESGRVYYVRTPGDGGSDANSGLSWDAAFATIRKAVDAASRTEVIDGEKAQVWVAAGTYEQDPQSGSDNCFEIVEAVNVYGAFPRTGNPSMNERRPFISDEVWFDDEGGSVTAADYETILRPATDNNDVRRVLGQADEFNPFSDSTEPYYFYVGEGKGDYEAHGDEVVEGLIMPAGNYLYATLGTTYYESWSFSWGQGTGSNPKTLVWVGSGFGKYSVVQKTFDWFYNRNVWDSIPGGGYSEFDGAGYYLCAEDEASHYSDGQYMYRMGTSGVDYVGNGGGNSVLKDSEFTYPTTWDGFTITGGYINSQQIDFIVTNVACRNGGAGAAIFTNVTLANSIVVGNTNETPNSGIEMRGGGVYCDEGTLVNCYVLNNTLGRTGNYTGYGAGVYMRNGTSYNCVIANNVGNANYSDGAGILVDNNNVFFNNTIVGNNSNGSSRGGGGICLWQDDGITSSLTAYNCVVLDNYARTIGSNAGNADVVVQNGTITCYNSIFNNTNNGNGYGSQGKRVEFVDCVDGVTTSIFENYVAGNYRIAGNGAGSIAINRGENEPVIDGEIYYLMDYTDMDFTARIKDCTIDAGAYEFEQTTATPSYDYDTGSYVYFVTQNGAGNASGSSPDNAACATKLQIVLNAAGELVRTTGQNATVRLGVPQEAGFTFTANTLSNANDPQSYTFVVPYGVQLEGGWDEDFNIRNPYNYPTSLSPVATVGGVTVNGYHAVTFGEPQTGQGGRTTVIDGVVLRDGQATSESGTGNSNARGGGAIVPSWGHVRNCVVSGNRALQGGGLYVMPGGLVTGTLVISNTAEQGAGIYADGTGVDESNRAHLVSVTVTDNEASSAGGGLYLEDGAAMTVNAVVWGNTAPSDKNVSGVLNTPFADAMLSAASGGTIDEFYPMNNCFVETYEIPGNFANTSLESGDDAEVKYFVVGSGTGRTLKDFSPMIKHGSSTSLVQYMITNHGMASTDMQGIARIQGDMDKVDGGAYAFYGGTTSLKNVVTRLFVSQTKTVALADGYNEADYRGKSFFTPFTWLDDALLYINEVRKEHPEYEDREFEILMAGGTYKPHYRRTAAGDPGASVVDQRLSSFVIPEGVNIYGGFSGTEEIASAGITEIPTADSTITVAAGGDINTLANARGMSDLNVNGVVEAWEFANQTILSGQINEGAATSQNVEHVVYTEGDGQIMLDGLTVNYGDATTGTATGGAGIYSDGVDCIVKGCRLLNCTAVNGGAAYIRHAGLTLLSSIVAGNRAVASGSGGAVYVDGGTETASLDAANTVFANNEAASYGGAVATNQAGGTVNVSLINTLMVRNSAGNYSAICSQPLSTRITNSVIWGNSAGRAFNLGASSFSHSASDDFDASVAGNDGNIALNTVNLAIDGPRFRSPSTVAGASGNSTSSLWNPAAISVLTDTGDGELAYGSSDMASAEGAYHDWWDGTTVSDYSTFYMGDADYDRYAGPRPTPQDTVPDPKVIDMGAYEYQYDNPFDLDDVYVDLQERGDGSGSSWDNATTDLRGAISALASGEYAGRKSTKTVHIRAGEYSPQQLNGGVAYRIQMAGATNANISVLNIRGAYDETGNQDFGNPTRFVVNPAVGQANTLLSVNVNTKNVNIEGISFEGASQNGMFITNAQAGATDGDSITVRNSAFRGNGTGVYFDQAVAGTDNLFVNTLFADGGNGIDASRAAAGRVTVVNATFANNTGAAIVGNADVYNSMSWQCGTGLTTDDANHNRDFAAIDNSDVARGPNFVNPAGGDYNIRPSIMVLDMGSHALYSTHAGKVPTEDYDLDGAPRRTGDEVDLGAYEYDAELRQVLYVRSGVAGSDESGDSWENAMSDLQGAVDLASIYHNKNNDSDGYVFVHNNVTAADGLRVSMPGVRVYGGMNGESTKGTPADVLARRGSFLNYQRQSTLPGLDITAASVVDGFTITGDVKVGSEGVLSTSVLSSSSATAEIDGLLYNSFVEGTVTGAGEAVNVTTPGTLEVATKKNVVENAVTNGYVTAPVWEYQLREDSPSIDGGTEKIASYMDKVGHREDLSGTSRLRGTVDNGCFETWRITAPETITAADRPTASHVVYVEPGQELSLATGLTTEASPFDVGFLLLQHGAGLVGGGNWVSLGNLAVERTLGGEAGDSWDLAYMPFTITSTTVDGTDYDAAAGTVAVQTYDGRARAAYNYQFSATDGAWSDITTPQGNTGMLLRSDDGEAHTVRFYGNSYTESSDAKSVRLTKYNYNDPWASPDDEGDRFTHAENMSWNMFGSPFLCGMNYSDMQYGRVIYLKNGNTFASVNTMDDDAAGGALGAGSAVLTQTATLADYETFEIAPRSATLGDDTARSGNLAVSVMRGDSEAADEFVLTAVPGDEASETFSLANDGVKMMSVDTTASQVYMMRDGHRYSMLSAVDVEGTVPVGLRLTDAGSYAIAIPDDCPAYDYETVILTDNATGRVVDLLDAPYRFNVAAGGDVEGRFTLQFNTSLSEGVGTVNVYSDSEGNVIVEGLETGMRIRLYDASGRMTANRIAASPTETFTGCECGVCLVQVIDGDSEPQVFKAMVGR